MLLLMGTRGRIGILITLACASALACAQAVEAGPDASPSRFNVTLAGQVTKSWDYVTTRVEGECTITTHVVGNRVVTLRSSRPTIVSATSRAGRASLQPRGRSLRDRAGDAGRVCDDDRARRRLRAAHPHHLPETARTLGNQTLAFFRSGRNEISFRRARDFGSGLSTTCPLEASEVRVRAPRAPSGSGRGVRAATLQQEDPLPDGDRKRRGDVSALGQSGGKSRRPRELVADVPPPLGRADRRNTPPSLETRGSSLG